ncbi:MAG: hypothetical protein H6R40_237, partial [Gemmatimonadetes bacterium]|nr:hypothetical protein [Gemmatimonadota bacterium]
MTRMPQRVRGPAILVAVLVLASRG